MGKANINTNNSNVKLDEIIKELAEIINKPAPRNALYNFYLKEHKKDIPDFINQFMKRAREISFFEREGYYKAMDIPFDKVKLIEDATEGIEEEDPAKIMEAWQNVFYWKTHFNGLLKWFYDEKLEYKLTKVWLFATGRAVPDEKLDYIDRIYILYSLVATGIITAEINDMKKGGVVLQKALAIVMDIDSYTSLDKPLAGMPDFYDFKKMANKKKSEWNPKTRKKEIQGIDSNPEAGKKSKRLKKIIDVLTTAGIKGKMVQYFSGLEESYEDSFEKKKK